MPTPDPDKQTPASSFQRERRYIVIKLTDVEKYLDEAQAKDLENLASLTAWGRKEDCRRPLECLVIESDWPEYEPTWKAIESRMTAPDSSPTGIVRAIQAKADELGTDFAGVLRRVLDNENPDPTRQSATQLQELKRAKREVQILNDKLIALTRVAESICIAEESRRATVEERRWLTTLAADARQSLARPAHTEGRGDKGGEA